MSSPIAAIVLAAGLSSRMAPRNKLLAPMPDSHAMIAHTVQNTLASKAAPVIVVTGFQAPLIAQALVGLPSRLVYAADFAEGLAASLRAGMAALPPETQAVLIVLGDMPLVASAVLDSLLTAYNPHAAHDIVIPVWQGRRGNPRLWGQRYFGALQSLDGDAGANRLLDLYPAHISEVASPNDLVLRDFDTAEAMNTLPAELSRGSSPKL